MAIFHNKRDGSWHDRGTWDTSKVPIGDSIVILDLDGGTVALSGSGVASTVSIRAHNTLAMTSGSLQAFDGFDIREFGTLQVLAGTNQISGRSFTNGGDVKVASGAALTLGEYSGTGNMTIVDNATVTLGGGNAFNSGTIALGSTGKETRLIFSGSGGFAGTGKVTLSESAKNIIAASGGLRNENTISGAGKLSAASITNVGSIVALGVENQLVLDAGLLKNTALIEASGKAGLLIGNTGAASRVENSGFIKANANSRAILSNLEVNNTGGTIQATGPGAELDLVATQISSGKLVSEGGSAVVVSGASALIGTDFDSRGNLTVGSGASLKLDGGSFKAGGDITVDGDFSGHAIDLTLQGSHTLAITGSMSGSGTTLTNVDYAIRGTGSLKVDTLSNRKAGVIDGPTIMAPLVTNAGTMNAVTIRSNKVENTGTISAATFRQLDESSTTFVINKSIINGSSFSGSSFGTMVVVNDRGVIQAGAHQQVTFEATEVSGGKLASSDGGVIRILAGNGHTALHLDQIGGGTTFVMNNGSHTTLSSESSHLTLDKVSISLAGSTAATTLDIGGANLQGGSKITLSDTATNSLKFDGTLNNANSTISGAGAIISSGSFSMLHNQAGGLIEANGTNALTLDVAQIKNDGTLEADGGTLKVVTPNTIEGGGKVIATHGGTVDMFAVQSFLGSLEYFGVGTILGPKSAPAGTITGFATGATYVFGEKTSFGRPLTTLWEANSSGTGGTLSIKSSPTETYATLRFTGVYTSLDFAATSVSYADGANHVVVNFVGSLTWAKPISGDWETAANWNPTGLYVPGAADRVLINAAGDAYKVRVTKDTTVKSVATGADATLEILAGRKFVTSEGGHLNAGLVKVEAGANFGVGALFTQESTGRIAASGADARITVYKGGFVGGSISTANGGVLIADRGLAMLTDVAVVNDSAINVAFHTKLILANSRVGGDGSVKVEKGSTLALVNSAIAGNAIAMAGTLEVGSDTILASSVTLDNGGIGSGASPATLTNRNTVTGTGTIGDSKLTLVNDGTIQTAIAGGALTIATGSNTVVNKGNISALAGGRLTVQSALNNTGELHAAGGSAIFTGAVTNSGLMDAQGTRSLIDFASTLANAGVVTASKGGLIDVRRQVTQQSTGEIHASGAGTILDFFSNSGVAGGLIALDGGAELNALRGGRVTLDHATLSINPGSAVNISGGTTFSLVDAVVNSDNGRIDAIGAGSVLALQNSTLDGGLYHFSGTELRVAGTVALNGANVEIEANARIASNGTPATLINAGFISGKGATLGDSKLTLINDGTITAGLGSSITIDTGSNAIVNNKTITTSDAGSKVTIASTLNNSSSGKVLTGAGIVDFNAAVTNNNGGLMQARGRTSVLDFHDSLHNLGVVSAEAGLVNVRGQVTQEPGGEIRAKGGGSRLDFFDGSGVSGGVISLSFAGELDALRGGKVTLDNTTLSLDRNARIEVNNATTLGLVGAVVNSTMNGDIDVRDSSILALQGATLNGGLYFVNADSQMQIVGNAALNGTNVAIVGRGKISSNGTPATLTNAGLIRGQGQGATVGDDTLTLINDGTLTADFDSELTIDTGSNTITNHKTITASDGASIVSIVSALNNDGSTAELLSGGGTVKTRRVDNTGLVEASGEGQIIIQGVLNNNGRVFASDGGHVTASVTNNSGDAIARGDLSVLVLGDEFHTATNSGHVIATNNGHVTFLNGVKNLAGSELRADAHSTVEVDGAATGGIARIVGDGALVDFAGSETEDTTTSVRFSKEGHGQFMLDNSERFAGTVAGFAESDVIAVRDVAFVAGMSSYDSSTDILTVSDGSHTAKIQLLGQYTSSDFAFATDPLSGGTLITGTATADPASATFLGHPV